MSPKFWELRLLKRFVKRKLLAVSWGSFGDVFKFPLTCNMFCPICCLIKPMILGSTCLPYPSETKKVSFAFPPLVEICACLMHKPFSRNILVISERSPSLSSVHSSNSSSCTKAQFLENDKNKGCFSKCQIFSCIGCVCLPSHSCETRTLWEGRYVYAMHEFPFFEVVYLPRRLASRWLLQGILQRVVAQLLNLQEAHPYV